MSISPASSPLWTRSPVRAEPSTSAPFSAAQCRRAPSACMACMLQGAGPGCCILQVFLALAALVPAAMSSSAHHTCTGPESLTPADSATICQAMCVSCTAGGSILKGKLLGSQRRHSCRHFYEAHHSLGATKTQRLLCAEVSQCTANPRDTLSQRRAESCDIKPGLHASMGSLNLVIKNVGRVAQKRADQVLHLGAEQHSACSSGAWPCAAVRRKG